MKRYLKVAALAASTACLGILGHPISAIATEAPTVRISAVGDVMLGGTAGPELKNLGYDYPFVYVADLLRRSDVVFGNLEGPLTNAGVPESNKKYLFRSPPQKVAPALRAAGFNVLSLANNHSLDYGAEGLADTLAALRSAGIEGIGGGQDLATARTPALMRVGNCTVGMLAYSLTLPETFFAALDKPGTAFGHEQHVRADVAKLRKSADIVLVSFHWGQEGTTVLRDYQTRLGHAAIDAGADAIIGHHPHILQGVERYRSGVILYSLGNFVFGSYSKDARRSAIAQLTFTRDTRWRLARLELAPINVDNIELNFQPRPLTGADADAVVAQLQALSRPLGTTIENQDGIAMVEFSPVAESRQR